MKGGVSKFSPYIFFFLTYIFYFNYVCVRPMKPTGKNTHQVKPCVNLFVCLLVCVCFLFVCYALSIKEGMIKSLYGCFLISEIQNFLRKNWGVTRKLERGNYQKGGGVGFERGGY